MWDTYKYFSIKYIFLCLGAFLIACFTVQNSLAASISINISKKQVNVSDTLTLTIVIRGVGIERIGIPQPFPNSFSVVNKADRPSLSQDSDGRPITVRVIEYTLQANSGGRFRLGNISFSHNGEFYQTSGQEIEVKGGEPPPKEKLDERLSKPIIPINVPIDVKLSAELSQSKAYVGEVVMLSVRVTSTTSVDQIKVVDIPAFINFWNKELVLSKKSTEYKEVIIKGLPYATQVIHRFRLSPTTSGKLSIPELTYSMVAGADPRKSKALTLKTSPISLEALALPNKGKPEEFSGAVGKSKLSVKLKDSITSVGVPTKLLIEVETTSNPETISPPTTPDNVANLKFYSPKAVKEDKEDDKEKNTVANKVVWETEVIASEEGKFTIPPLSFAYFDPDSNKYKTIQSQPLSLEVSASANAGLNINKTTPAPATNLLPFSALSYLIMLILLTVGVAIGFKLKQNIFLAKAKTVSAIEVPPIVVPAETEPVISKISDPSSFAPPGLVIPAPPIAPTLPIAPTPLISNTPTPDTSITTPIPASSFIPPPITPLTLTPITPAQMQIPSEPILALPTPETTSKPVLESLSESDSQPIMAAMPEPVAPISPIILTTSYTAPFAPSKASKNKTGKPNKGTKTSKFDKPKPLSTPLTDSLEIVNNKIEPFSDIIPQELTPSSPLPTIPTIPTISDLAETTNISQLAPVLPNFPSSTSSPSSVLESEFALEASNTTSSAKIVEPVAQLASYLEPTTPITSINEAPKESINKPTTPEEPTIPEFIPESIAPTLPITPLVFLPTLSTEPIVENLSTPIESNQAIALQPVVSSDLLSISAELKETPSPILTVKPEEAETISPVGLEEISILLPEPVEQVTLTKEIETAKIVESKPEQILETILEKPISTPAPIPEREVLKPILSKPNAVIIPSKTFKADALRLVNAAYGKLHRGDERAYQKEILKALTLVFENGFRIPTSELSNERMLELLNNKGADLNLRDSIIKLYQECEQNAFSTIETKYVPNSDKDYVRFVKVKALVEKFLILVS